MVRKYILALKMTREAIRGKEKGLIFWVIVRGLSLTCSPIIFPLTIKILFDTLQVYDNMKTLKTCVFIILYIIPVYFLNYFISYYSDAWVIKNVYSWMRDNIVKLLSLPYDKVSESYDTGNLQNCIISGAWAGIQAWVHLFRLISPIITVIVLIGFMVSYSPFFLLFIGIVTFLDIAINEFEAKKRYEIYVGINNNNIKREQRIGEIVTKIEYICMNDMYSFVIDDYRRVQVEIWRKEKENTLCTFFFEAINEVVERTVTSLLVFKLYDFMSILQLSAGAIGSANIIFDNLRQRIKYVKSQTEATVSKVKPIDRLNTLMNINCEDMDKKRKTIYDNSERQFLLNGVSYLIADTHILDGINIEIKRKEKVAVIGKNGSGKSTFLKLLAGLYTPSSGEIQIINSQDAESVISYAPAAALMFRDVSVLENMEMSVNERPSIDVAYLIERLGLSVLVNNNAGQISGGQAQRVNVVRSALKDANIYLMDEPTASLDKESSVVIGEIIRSVIEGTIIFITHNPLMLDYADRVVIFDNGQIVYDGDPHDCKYCEYYSRWVAEIQN